MIIDTHVHVWALDDAHQPSPSARMRPPKEAGPVEWLIDDMEKHQVDRVVLVQMSAFAWDNTYIVECLQRYPGLFKGIGLVDPLSPTNGADLRYWLERGLSGVRLHPLNYPELPCWVDSSTHDRLWDVAADFDAILQFHMRPEHAEPLARMIERHPNVRVIVDHLGKPDVTEPPPYPSFDPVLKLANYPQVWLKIGDYQVASQEAYPWRDTFPFVAKLKEAFGPDRMVWGTGWPGKHRLVPLEQAIRYVREEIPCFSDDDLAKILDATPRRLFNFQ